MLAVIHTDPVAMAKAADALLKPMLTVRQETKLIIHLLFVFFCFWCVFVFVFVFVFVNTLINSVTSVVCGRISSLEATASCSDWWCRLSLMG